VLTFLAVRDDALRPEQAIGSAPSHWTARVHPRHLRAAPPVPARRPALPGLTRRTVPHLSPRASRLRVPRPAPKRTRAG
jgi:hypothetical protein